MTMMDPKPRSEPLDRLLGHESRSHSLQCRLEGMLVARTHTRTGSIRKLWVTLISFSKIEDRS